MEELIARQMVSLIRCSAISLLCSILLILRWKILSGQLRGLSDD
ncbi:hypothetical protein QYF36_024477 [Acer negundo]|nr:hypothetical protein QYF36_024477 [Acer negundo]